MIDFGTATFLGKIFDTELNQFIDEDFKIDEGRPSDSFMKNVEYNEDHQITNNEKKKPKSQQKVVILPREVTQKIR